VKCEGWRMLRYLKRSNQAIAISTRQKVNTGTARLASTVNGSDWRIRPLMAVLHLPIL